MLVALGMTLVIASRGIDLSVGAVVAVSGALACAHIAASDDPAGAGTVVTAMGIALGVAVGLGLWNGMLVSVFGVQPIIATLVLMTAGRGIALLITDGQIVTVTSAPFKVLGSGFVFGLPVAILVSLSVFALVGLLTRRTALGMLLESVGINPEASRLAGVRYRTIVFAVYVFCALCAGIAGLMIASNISAADANNAGLWIEMDAILAVVIGGTSLAGWTFQPDRHHPRRAHHPDADHHGVHRRHHPGDHAGVQGAGGDRRLPAAGAEVPGPGVATAQAAGRTHGPRRDRRDRRTAGLGAVTADDGRQVRKS